jgi:hypothetical protein
LRARRGPAVGVSLCGPMVIVDQATGTRATNQPEPEGSHPAFRVSWTAPSSGADYGGSASPCTCFRRRTPIWTAASHASRIVPSHSARAGAHRSDDGFNEHLDTLEGRLDAARMASARRAVESSGSDRAEAIAMPWPSDANAAAGFRRGGQRTARRDSRRACLLHRHRRLGQFARGCSPCRSVGTRGGESQQSFVGNFEAASGPPTVCCWTISRRDGADRFVASRTSATCSAPQPTGHRRRMLPWQRRATMGQRCERRRRRAIGRSRSASPSCVGASLMGPC